jgi:chromosome segregation ATPase
MSLARQLEGANEQLVQTQRRIDAVEADNRRLMQDLYGLRQTNQMLNERVATIIKRAAAAGDANKILSSRLMNAERERDAIRALYGAEQQRAKEMEGIVQQTRTESILREIQVSRRTAGVVSTSTVSQGQPFDESVLDSLLTGDDGDDVDESTLTGNGDKK